MFDAILLFRDALLGALIIGLACSVLGVYVVLRRIVFVGAALAELSTAGIAFALWLEGVAWAQGAAGHSLAFSIVVTLAGVLFFSEQGGRARIPHEATIGVTYAVAAAVAILLIAKSTSGEAHDIFLHGNILGITQRDMLVLAGIALPVMLTHVVFFKEFLFISFDRETARTLGYRVRWWNLLLYLTLGLVIAFAMQFAGVMLVFNFLVLPAVTALLLARSMGGMFVISVSAALAAALIGFSLSVPFDLPTGPAIIAVSGVIALISWGARLAQRR